LNITANVADKGNSEAEFYHCPKAGNNKGNNILSAMFVPGEQRMYVALESGQDKTYQTACCGVYLKMDMSVWFGKKETEERDEHLQME
jgi:hypothetical protein